LILLYAPVETGIGVYQTHSLAEKLQ
jgi:hypothetical protein